MYPWPRAAGGVRAHDSGLAATFPHSSTGALVFGLSRVDLVGVLVLHTPARDIDTVRSTHVSLQRSCRVCTRDPPSRSRKLHDQLERTY